MEYRYKIREDKNGAYILFSKVFVKRHKLKAGQPVRLQVLSEDKLIAKIGKQQFLMKVKK